MSSAVLDAGPLIHLSELQALDVLSDFEVLFVSPSVWIEVAGHQPGALVYSDLNFQKTEIPDVDVSLATLSQALSLDQGEAEALALMAFHRDAIFLTDDAAARLAAEESGYKVHGTIGLLVRAVRKGHRAPDDVLSILGHIHENSTLYIRQSLVSDVIKRLEKEWFNR